MRSLKVSWSSKITPTFLTKVDEVIVKEPSWMVKSSTRAGVCVQVGKEFHLMRTQQFSLVEYIEVENLIFC